MIQTYVHAVRMWAALRRGPWARPRGRTVHGEMVRNQGSGLLDGDGASAGDGALSRGRPTT